MKLFRKTILLSACLLFFSFAASAQQIKTWICPPSSAGSFTNVLADNQVLEVLSGSFTSDSQVEITRGKDVLLMGTGGANLNIPFVIAGPATVIFRKTSTGGQGTILSYRISQQPK